MERLELLFLHLDNKGVLLWRDEPVGVKTVHTDELLEGGEVGVGLAMPSQKEIDCKPVKTVE